MIEEWKPVIGLEGLYEVANTGAVRALPRAVVRKNGWVNTCKGGPVKPQNHKNGYVIVHLHKEGIHFTKRLHRVVAQAHLSNPDNLPEVNHKDLNKRNNDSENLEWSSGKDNKCHAMANGAKVGKAKLDMHTVRKLREDRAAGHTLKELISKYKLCKSHISMICNNRCWKEEEYAQHL